MSNNEQNFKSLGTLLSVAGALSFISGIFSCFNKRIMIISNILIILGVFLVLGLEKFISFITNKKRIVPAIIYLVGFILILINWRIIGGLTEIVGFLSLFGGFLPRFMNMAQKLPYVGKYFRFALPSFFYKEANDETLPL